MYNLADFPIKTDVKIKMNRFWRLFWIFFKIGAFTLGSGYAMMPQIRRELVTRMKWLDEDEFIDIVAVTQSAPGPIAVNLAVFLGLRVAGIKGIIAALAAEVNESVENIGARRLHTILEKLLEDVSFTAAERQGGRRRRKTRD